MFSPICKNILLPEIWINIISKLDCKSILSMSQISNFLSIYVPKIIYTQKGSYWDFLDLMGNLLNI